MSTGLTYLSIIDSNASNPQAGTTLNVFSSYQEAYDFAEWWMRAVTFQIQGSYGQHLLIWTSGPNPNGYWYYDGADVVFIRY